MDVRTATESTMQAWPQRMSAIVLVVNDVATAKQFYHTTFGVPILFEDADAVMFQIGPTYIKLLHTTAAAELYAPATVPRHPSESHVVFTVPVDDVDAMCGALQAHGVQLLNGPVDRPWGVRTASFRDPDGHIWEIAQVLDTE